MRVETTRTAPARPPSQTLISLERMARERVLWLPPGGVSAERLARRAAAGRLWGVDDRDADDVGGRTVFRRARVDDDT